MQAQFPNGEPVRIYLSAAARTAAANAVAVTLVSAAGVARTLAADERLLIYWLDNVGSDSTKFNILDGGGTTIPANLLGSFSTMQVGFIFRPIACKRATAPKVYFPGDSGDNTHTNVTFGYGEIIKS